MGRFRRLCQEHRDRIYTFAFYYMGNREDAEDITQEVLFRLWHHGLRMDDESVAAWLTRVARNACLDALRQRHRYRSVVSTQDPGPVLQRTPAVEAGDVDLRRQLEAALTRRLSTLTLPDWERVVQVREPDQRVQFYVRTEDETIVGLLVLVGNPSEFVCINIVGPLDIAQVGRIGRKFDIEPLDSIDFGAATPKAPRKD